MRVKLLLIFFLLYASMGCNSKEKENETKTEMRFDRQQWVVEKDRTFPYRERMLKHLIDSVKLKGLTKTELLQLLGQPSRTDSNYLFYTINKNYLGNTQFIINSKTLVIKFGADSLVEWRKIHG